MNYPPLDDYDTYATMEAVPVALDFSLSTNGGSDIASDLSAMTAEEIMALADTQRKKSQADSGGFSGFAEKRTNARPMPAESVRISCGFTPEPLPERYQPPVYPVDALGELLGEAAKKFAYHVQVPLGMAAQSVLAAAALVAQAHINVARGNIGVGPVSLFCLTVADSGERKSSIDKLALLPVREYEKARYEQAKEDNQRYKSELDAWQLRRESIIKAVGDNKKAALSHEQQQVLARTLAEHEQVKPAPPEFSNITFEEPTAEGVWRHYQRGLPSAGLFSDEGISFFGGHGMSAESRGRTIGSLSQLWDGKPLTRTRAAEGESGVMAGRRLSAHLMIQPVVSAQVLSDPLLQGQGFLARFLVCHEPSLMGRRFLSGRKPTENVHKEPAVIRYWDCLRAVLREPMPRDPETGDLQLQTVKIQEAAYDTWALLHDGVEDQLNAEGSFRDIKAFAAKAADNAARIAAILAFVENRATTAFESAEYVVTPEHIERAGRLIGYYLESMGLRTREALDSGAELEAADLLVWIKANGGQLAAANFKMLPVIFRSAKKARQLLAVLVDMGHLKVVSYGGKGDKPNVWEVVAYD